MTTPANFLTDFPTNLPAELVQTLVNTSNVRIERIVSHGHTSPEGFWYDQAESEWVLLVEGRARLRLEEEIIEMKPGDYLTIPAHKRHRVEWTDPQQFTIWLAVYYV